MKPATLILFLLTCISFQAQTVPGKTNGASPTSAIQATPAPTAYTLPPDKLAKAHALYTLRVRLLIIDGVWSLVVLLGLLYGGIAARFRDWAEKVSQKRFVQALVAVPLLLLTLSVLDLPLSIYQHRVSLQYGLSVQGWGSWTWDEFKGLMVTLVVFTPLLWGMLALVRRSPKRWWFYAWLMALPLMVLVIFLVPVVLDPMFNRFEPLEARQPRLVEAIEKVTQRGGLMIPRSRMYEMAASEKVTTINAYVTGLGASKRVVVWDTAIQKMPQPEMLFVFGHEMGHYVLNHIYKGLAFGAVLAFVGLYLLYWISGWMIKRFRQPWRLRDLDDWAALPAIFLIMGVLQFLGQPAAAAFSRHVEHQADIYGLEVTHDINANSQETAARAFQTLGEEALSYPYPDTWMVFLYYDHPPIADRVKFSREYDPWGKGEQPEFVK